MTVGRGLGTVRRVVPLGRGAERARTWETEQEDFLVLSDGEALANAVLDRRGHVNGRCGSGTSRGALLARDATWEPCVLIGSQ